jgi:hypothetical protein
LYLVTSTAGMTDDICYHCTWYTLHKIGKSKAGLY